MLLPKARRLTRPVAANKLFGVENTVQSAEQQPRGMVPAVHSACRIVDALARTDREGATLSELGRRLGLSKSSLHGLLATLHAHGYVQRDPGSRRYRLGAALVTLGRAAAGQLRAAALVGQRLPALAGEHHLTFAVAQVTEYGDAQVIDRAYPVSAVHVGLALGSRYGVFDGAIGKCLLAAMSRSEAERLVRGVQIPRHTERTIADPEALLEEIARVREQGWGASEGELKENHAVAAPLFDAAGAAELIVFAVGFPGQLDAATIPAIGAVLRKTADAVREQLGASGGEHAR